MAAGGREGQPTKASERYYSKLISVCAVESKCSLPCELAATFMT